MACNQGDKPALVLFLKWLTTLYLILLKILKIWPELLGKGLVIIVNTGFISTNITLFSAYLMN